ncbi:hypothetical protein V8G54_023504 [Vigna mungo]|uniref:peptidylprolyl isomerase n=1 Tax=Vigna mungo TaxID=3915 RepID=A0AAQ3N5J0_VIGMU
MQSDPHVGKKHAFRTYFCSSYTSPLQDKDESNLCVWGHGRMTSSEMSAIASSLLLPLGSTCGKSPSFTPPQSILLDKFRRLVVKVESSETRECTTAMFNANSRRNFLGLALGVSGLFIGSLDASGAGLPPEEKPKLCDETCEKELENETGFCKMMNRVKSWEVYINVAEDMTISLNFLSLKVVPMVTTGSGLQYKDIKVGQGPSPPIGFQVIPGLDEGILSMKVGGKRRLYIPGSLAFPKGLNSAPGRPRVAPSSPVIFDVSLEYIPGLEVDEE